MAKTRKKGEAGEAGAVNEEEQKSALLEEFGALVDESLVLLLFHEQGFAAAQRALTEISQNVREEEASCFDTGDLRDSEGGSNRDGGGGLSPLTNEGTFSSWTTATTTTASDGDACRGSRLQSTVADELPSAELEAMLKSVFPMLKDTDVRRAVKEAGGDAARASDILLNIKHLEETGQRPKGVEGFFVPDEVSAAAGSRKTRRKKRAAAQAKDRQWLAVDYKLAKDEDDEVETAESSQPPRRSTPSTATSYTERAEVAQKSWAAAGASYEAATAAYRRGRSDPLFRQVAAVYADRGRAQSAAAQRAQSAAADAFVDEQSSGDTVDVHYVAVHDGVRIALERTQQWWRQLGEDRARKAREEPLRVVTGSGVHSAKGVSRMYGEVGAALEREGWRVQPRNGHYFVTGKR